MTLRRGRDERPRPLLCVYLTAKVPSIRDTTTVVAAIIPDLTLIKVMIVFFSRGAKSTKPDQFIKAVKADRCGPRARRRGERARLPEPGRSVQKRLLVSANGAAGGGGGRPTEHGLPPTMLNPRDPPSRRRTAVTLLASPSYGQRGETRWSERLGILGILGALGVLGDAAVMHLFKGRAAVWETTTRAGEAVKDNGRIRE